MWNGVTIGCQIIICANQWVFFIEFDGWFFLIKVDHFHPNGVAPFIVGLVPAK